MTQWWKPILIVCAMAGLGSILVTLLMPNYYKATTIFLASSPDQAKPEVIFGLNTGNSQYYGNKDDIDRILTIGESKQLKDFLIDSFKLYQHYQIDTTSIKARFKIEKKLAKFMGIVKTKREAIELSFEDKDRDFASVVANAARNKIDMLSQNLIKLTQEKAISALENNLLRKKSIQATLGDTLEAVRARYGIYNIGAQTEAISQQLAQAKASLSRSKARLNSLRDKPIPNDTIIYLEAEISGREAEIESLNDEIKLLNSGFGETRSLDVQYTDATNTMTVDLERLKRWRSAYQSQVSAIILIQEAQPPIVKSRPKRSILVVAAVGIAFFFSLIGILLLEYYRRFDWNQLADAS